MEIGENRLAAFVARCWGEPRGLKLEVRPLRGGLESAGVAEVTARFFDARDRPRSYGFVVKRLAGKPAREADIYQRLVSPLGGSIAPALLEVEREGPAGCLLFLEKVRPVRRWPWRDEEAARRLLGRLAHLHATATPVQAMEVLSDWDYESELVERTRLAAEALAALPREEAFLRLRGGRGSLRRVEEALPELRRQLLAFAPHDTAAIHGDAHPGNVLVLSGDRPVLLDWGRARLGSPLEDVSSWLQSLGYWEPAAKRRHDTLLTGYLAARGLPARAGRELRDAYWLAGASNALSGALLVHLRAALDALPGSRQRTTAIHAAEDASRVIRRAAACWREARVPRSHLREIVIGHHPAGLLGTQKRPAPGARQKKRSRLRRERPAGGRRAGGGNPASSQPSGSGTTEHRYQSPSAVTRNASTRAPSSQNMALP